MCGRLRRPPALRVSAGVGPRTSGTRLTAGQSKRGRATLGTGGPDASKPNYPSADGRFFSEETTMLSAACFEWSKSIALREFCDALVRWISTRDSELLAFRNACTELCAEAREQETSAEQLLICIKTACPDLARVLLASSDDDPRAKRYLSAMNSLWECFFSSAE